MERIELLINKLSEQYKNNAAPAVMIATIQMIETEILRRNKETQVLGTSKIEVIVPNRPLLNVAEPASERQVNGDKELYSLEVNEMEEDEDILLQLEQMNQSPEMKNTEPKLSPEKKAIFKDLIEDVPTFFHQDKTRNHHVDHERLSDDAFQKEHGRIRDLTKAIPLQDREKFIRDLFMDDEFMYQRSIKTINNFHIYAEAEYWIKRELKSKLGWLTDDPLVRSFDDFIRRRFV